MQATVIAVNNFIMETWKDIEGYEGYYQISSLGNARSLDRVVPHKRNKLGKARLKGGPLKVRVSDRGYISYALRKNGKMKSVKAHRLVGLAFLLNPFNFAELNHIDGDKKNNAVENLEWCTRQHNIIHGFKMGLIKVPRGEKQRSAKLSEETVFCIRSNYKEGKTSISEMAKNLNVNYSTINRVVKRKTWKHI